MVVFAGQGDARRSMALLWRTTGAADARTGPGPKPALTIDKIVEAAIAIADGQGMAALSMRAVGERLGRTAMALYTYVPSKSELLDLMYDHALAELPTNYPQPDWRAAATAWAKDLREFYLRHPWMLQVSQARPVLGPNEYRSMETVLHVLHRTGLSPRMMQRVVGALFHFVRGNAQVIAETRQAAGATGVTDDEWWLARSPMLTEMAPDFTERFPMINMLADAGAYDGEDTETPYLEQEARRTFEVGLTVLLDGIDAQRAATRQQR